MVNKSVLIAVCLSPFLSRSQNVPDEKALIFQIDFQDQFKQDTVSLILNNDTVFSRVVLTSDRVLGITDKIVKIYTMGKDKMEVHSNGFTSATGYRQTMDLAIIINSSKRIYTTNFNKGKFLRISKACKDDTYVMQSVRHFQYDSMMRLKRNKRCGQ